jgi:hypothetical protein
MIDKCNLISPSATETFNFTATYSTDTKISNMDSAQFREAAHTAIDESKFMKIELMTLDATILTTDIQ